MLYKQYDADILGRLHNVELEMLKDFDSFCRENDIDYFVCGGTALGVARHKGFIPWDDDIDIGMTRVNFDKLICSSDKLSPKYTVISRHNTGNFPLMTAWVSLNGSKFRILKSPRIDNGIYLDVFCFDNVSDNEKKMRRQMRSGWLWGKLLILRYMDDPILYHSGVWEKIIRICCKMVHFTLKMINRDPEKLYIRAYKSATMLRGHKTKKVAYMFDPTPYTSMIDIADIEPTIDGDFEGYRVKIPANIDAYLSRRYGDDYMVLPPLEKRHNHPPYELEFPKT